MSDDITFGVEIECLIPAANAPTVGGYHAGVQIQGLPAGWNAQHDGSIRRTNRHTVGVEVVSPVLKGADGIAQLKTVCEWLKRVGAKVNRSTGLHIHVGVADRSAEALKRLVTVAANFEKAIYASTGTKAREQGVYCQSVQNSVRHQQGEFSRVDRYRVLNIVTGRPTVEFRAFAGTTNFLKIVAYVRLCIGMVERAQETKRLPAWRAKDVSATSPIKRGGEGLTALNRLFYWLGWTKGRVNQPYGMVGKDAGPALRTCKNQLVRLARKYDGGTV